MIEEVAEVCEFAKRVGLKATRSIKVEELIMENRKAVNYIGMPVWGERHTNLFLNYALPSLLASGNLPYLASAGDSEFAIYTNAEFAEVMRAHPAIKYLEGLMPVTYNFIETKEVKSKWTAMRTSNRLMIEEADRRDAVLYLLVPDALWSN